MGMGRNKDRWNFRSRDQRGISADAGMEHMCNDMDRMYKSAMVENCYRMIDSCHIKVAAILQICGLENWMFCRIWVDVIIWTEYNQM